jgi:hypothetical protein
LHPLGSLQPSDRSDAGPPKGKPAEGGLVTPHSVVNHFVVDPRVEAETGLRSQSVGERFLTGTSQNEVNMRDSDVVWPDVILFHARQGREITGELDL